MSFSVNRSAAVRWISFLLALLVLPWGFYFKERSASAALQRSVTNNYIHAFSELTASLDKMDAALQKGVYVTTGPMFSSLCSQVFSQAMVGQMALGQLPYAHRQLEQTAAFLARTGDYAQAMSRRAALEGVCPQEEAEHWLSLSQTAQQLSRQLDELELELMDGSFTIADVEEAEALLASEREFGSHPQGFQGIEADFPELPHLIYDGPFSQHLEQRRPAMLEGKGEINQEEGQAIAARILHQQEVTFLGERGGELPVYLYSVADGRSMVEITKQGGYLLNYLTESVPSFSRLTAGQAIEAAEKFLTELEMEHMTESYYTIQSNTAVINFCAQQDGVRCYPDLVKVKVSLADGEILGYEGKGYLMNHRQRQIPDFTLTREEAGELISDRLELVALRPALIPSRGEYEIYCWEALCEDRDGKHILSYLNAETGAEEQLLLLIEDENGVLTI